MTELDCKFNLAAHGDFVERSYWNLFIKNEFPSYGVFWEQNIAPITNRPHDIHAKSDEELKELGKSNWNILISQLHYSVLSHLIGAYEIIHGKVDQHGVVACFGRLCGAIDVADELLQRWNNPLDETSRDWGWRASKNMRKKRREKHPHPSVLLQVIHYRNALIHGQVMPGLKSQHNNEWLPNLDEKIWTQYQDWRTLTNRHMTSNELNSNFTEQHALLEQAWNTVLKYLESNWKNNLC